MSATVLRINDLLLEHCDELCRMSSNGVKLITSFTEDIGLIQGDSELILKAIIALTTNAQEAMPNGGWLTISTSNVTIDGNQSEIQCYHPGPYVLVEITDTGIGMSEEVLDRLFEPFFTTKSPPHQGFGATHAYGIVLNHGGSLHVESKLGQGTTVRIYFPFAGA